MRLTRAVGAHGEPQALLAVVVHEDREEQVRVGRAEGLPTEVDPQLQRTGRAVEAELTATTIVSVPAGPDVEELAPSQPAAPVAATTPTPRATT